MPSASLVSAGSRSSKGVLTSSNGVTSQSASRPVPAPRGTAT
jgi:hypothetical protein